MEFTGKIPQKPESKKLLTDGHFSENRGYNTFVSLLAKDFAMYYSAVTPYLQTGTTGAGG